MTASTSESVIFGRINLLQGLKQSWVHFLLRKKQDIHNDINDNNDTTLYRGG